MVVIAPVDPQPIVTEPVTTEPVITEPVVTEPVTHEPVSADPVIADPIITDPVATDPVVTNPVIPAPAGNEKGSLYHLPLASVQPDPEQPRKFFDEQALAELSASITSHGVLQPILVREGAMGLYFIVSGERRYQAAKKAGLATIPAILTDGEPAEISIIENLLRENLTAIEEAEAIERLRAAHDYSLGAMASALGKSDSTLSEILSLNKLPAEVKDDCRNDPKTNRSILAVIARQKTPEKMTTLYTRYKESGLTRGEIRKRTAKPKPEDAPLDLAFVDQFYNRLDLLEITKLTPEQKKSLFVTLGQLRSMAYQRMKLLK